MRRQLDTTTGTPQQTVASLLNPPATPGTGQRVAWLDLPEGAETLAIARRYADTGDAVATGLSVVVTEDTQAFLSRQGELRFFAPPGVPVMHLPDWETLPYDAFSPDQDIVSERLKTLAHLKSLDQATQAILVVPVNTLMQRLPPTSFLDAYAFALRIGQRFDLHRERERLQSVGYTGVDTVTEPGEFAVRGAIMDVYPMGAPLPIRIDLDDDEIETLRSFDPDSQRTIEQIETLALLPAKEFPFDPAAIARFRNNWHNTFDADVRRCTVYQDVSAALMPSGVEYYLPLFFDGMSSALSTLFDYLPENVTVFLDDGADAAIRRFEGGVRDRYEDLRHDVERPILPPADLFLRTDEVFGHVKRLARVDVNGGRTHTTTFDVEALPDLAANPRARDPGAAIARFTDGFAGRILFVAESAGRREILEEFLARSGIRPTEVDDFEQFLNGDSAVSIAIADAHCGFMTSDWALVTQSCLFGRPNLDDRRALGRARQLDPEQIVRNLTELNAGAPVVHEQHGVGRYRGLETLEIDGETHEFLMLEYADEARLYVPVTSLHLISRYAGTDDEHAPLHRLGSDQWEKAKRKAAERAFDAAAELLDIYARRELRRAAKLNRPGPDYERFAAQFAFDLTADQRTAIDAVIDDLCSEKATDRLICGDVGFGKTEVAMRAAFLAVHSGKQVIVLVPTTLLAQQHYDTFRDRFADWPVQIEVVSRLRADSEIEGVQGRLKDGKVDILIGTHKLLNAGFRYSDLGLIVIDEEHRFGVRQKEQLKALRAEVDVLTLTATPIPRTLNMAMSGIRDLSIIATPPARRLAIRTFLHESSNHLVREAITRELTRGGQVFYLHNEVRSIQHAADTIADLVPQARIGIGHGQMPKRELEQVMNDFYHRQINVLVCTTIIENGIDVPNANTIIMDRADKLGLAQLHQLRGRVGRSHRQAYAYLLIPHRSAITTDAMKRLEAIEAAGELGVGFTLATHDLEIRGAGELLGEDQSGQIESVGFSLYMDLLERAVNSIRSGQQPDVGDPIRTGVFEVNMHAPALIPDDYLPDVHSRLIFYKRIASAATADALDELQVEMIDRFGMIPPSLKRLFQVTAVKLEIEAVGISRVDFGPASGRVEFDSNTRISPAALVALVQNDPRRYQLDGGSTLRVKAELPEFEDRLTFVHELIASLGTRLEQAANA